MKKQSVQEEPIARKVSWPFISGARHNKIVREIIADYEQALNEDADEAVKASGHMKELVEDLDKAHKELCEASSKFTRFCMNMASLGARIYFNETQYRDHFYIVHVIPELKKERGTLDSFMLQFYDSVQSILPDRWEWNKDMTFKKYFGDIDKIEKAPEKIIELTVFLQGELDALYTTIRRQGVAEAMKEKKVTGSDVRD